MEQGWDSRMLGNDAGYCHAGLYAHLLGGRMVRYRKHFDQPILVP